MSIEKTIADLMTAVNHQVAEIRANETHRVASGQRLDDAVKNEAIAQASLQQVTTDLKKAEKELAEVRSTISAIRRDAEKARDLILSRAEEAAARIVEGAERAVEAAANLLRKPAA